MTEANPTTAIIADPAAVELRSIEANAPSHNQAEVVSETIQLLEETLHVSKRDAVTGTVRVSTRTETRDEVAEVALDRNVVDVTRVPVGRLVEAAPPVRTEGNLTVVPVLEERFVVVKQLYLAEELHIRHRVESTVEQVSVQLRRQTATVERVDAEGRVTAEPETSA